MHSKVSREQSLPEVARVWWLGHSLAFSQASRTVLILGMWLFGLTDTVSLPDINNVVNCKVYKSIQPFLAIGYPELLAKFQYQQTFPVKIRR